MQLYTDSVKSLRGVIVKHRDLKMPLAQFADPWQKLPVGHLENEVSYIVYNAEARLLCNITFNPILVSQRNVKAVPLRDKYFTSVRNTSIKVCVSCETFRL